MVSKRYPSRDGSFGVTVTPQIIKETDQLRGDIPRSRWVERALKMYNGCVKEQQQQEQTGVWGTGHQPAAPAPSTATPTPEVAALKTTKALSKEVL